MPALAFEYSDNEEQGPEIQTLTEFTTTTSEPERIVKPAALVIERIPNSFRKGTGYVPDALRQRRGRPDGKSIAELEALERARNNVYGLNKATVKSNTGLSSGSLPPSFTIEKSSRPALTEEEFAIQELLHPAQDDQPQHVISRTSGNELFSHSTAVHPEMSTLEEYEAIPVESFGLAMLRGMGYDPEKEAANSKVKEKQRRPDFLGLGASERPEESKSAEELAKKPYQKRKEERNYVPVVKVNKRTGEVVMEEAANGSRASRESSIPGLNGSEKHREGKRVDGDESRERQSNYESSRLRDDRRYVDKDSSRVKEGKHRDDRHRYRGRSSRSPSRRASSRDRDRDRDRDRRRVRDYDRDHSKRYRDGRDRR